MAEDEGMDARSEEIAEVRAHLVEARRCAVGDPDAKLAWTTWSTAARIDHLWQGGWRWTDIQRRLGRARVGDDAALWMAICERNPAFLAAARQILEYETRTGSSETSPGAPGAFAHAASLGRLKSRLRSGDAGTEVDR